MLGTAARASVKDASDARQVQRASRVVKRRQERLTVALRTVMQTPEGRLVFWELLAAFGVFREVFDTHGSLMAFNCGRQSAGREIMHDLLSVDPEAYQLMEREMRALAKREEQETDAAQQPRSEETVAT